MNKALVLVRDKVIPHAPKVILAGSFLIGALKGLKISDAMRAERIIRDRFH